MIAETLLLLSLALAGYAFIGYPLLAILLALSSLRWPELRVLTG